MRLVTSLLSCVLSPNFLSGISVLRSLMVFVLICGFCNSFNIDVTRPLVFQGTTNTNFGAALDLLNNTDGKWLVVGAPLDTLSNAEGIYTKTGNTFLCRIHLDRNLTDVSECSELNFTEIGRIVSNNSMLGASVMVLEKTTVVCAPGFQNPLKSNATSGACVFFQNEAPTNISQFLIRIPSPDEYSFSWSMFGFSSTAGIDETFPYVIGGPNSGFQAGGLAAFSLTGRGLISKNIPGTDSTQPGAYFGYSLDIGTFDIGKKYYVAGRPGFANKDGNIGNVEILELIGNSKTTKKLIAGHQLGGGFGHSVCVADVNGDSFDDVLIGAPLEYINQSNGNIVIDSGAVYIYFGIGSPDIIKETPIVIRGSEKQWARFGTSIVHLGDISNDGISDIAIGAPFEDGHRGAVYIYNGQAGDSAKPWMFSQRISANDIDQGIGALGYYISRSQVDIDDNLYGDLAVSGFKSDKVIVLRTRPVANVVAEILTTPDYIPLNSTGLDCNLGSDYPCVTLKIRFLVSGKGLEKGVYLNYSLESDITSESERFMLRYNDSHVNNLNKSLESQLILLKPGDETFVNVALTVNTVDWRFFKSLEEPVTVKLTFALSELTFEDGVPPMLHTDTKTTQTKKLEINRNCSSDPCKPAHVALMQAADGNMTLQQNQELSVHLTLINTGDPVERTEFFVQTFPNLEFSRVIEGSNDLRCNNVSFDTLFCEMRPVRFYPHQRYLFALNFFIDPDAVVAYNSDHVKVEVSFNSSEGGGTRKFVLNNHFNLRSNVRVIGGSDFSELILASSSGAIFKYSISFDIHNDGPSPLGSNLKIPIASGHSNSDIVRGISVTKAPKGCYMKSDNLEIKTLYEPENIKSESLTDEETTDDGHTEINCGMPSISCTYLTCDLGYVKTTEFQTVEFTIDLDSGVLANMLKEQKSETGLYVISGDVQRYDNNIPAYINVTEAARVSLRVSIGSLGQQSTDILWYTIGGSAGGFLILIIIALVLWKCGFFNRKRRGEIERAKRQSQIKQRQSNMMSSFVHKELNKNSSPPLNGNKEESKLFRLSAKKDYPDLDIQDR